MNKENLTISGETSSLTYKKIFTFWYPLAATWLMMAVENPLLTAVIARLAEPKFNLAAFGVAFSFALVMEAPIIMIMSATTALASDKGAFFKLRRFTYGLNAIVTSVLIIGLLPPVFYFIAEGLIGLPHAVAKITHISTLLLLPWPAAIGYRRFYHGIMIRYNLTRRVAYSTTIRLTAMASSAFILYRLDIKGAYVGAAALSVGVVSEAIASRLLANSSVRGILNEGKLPNIDDNEETEKKVLTYRYIIKFYIPLALMAILALGVHPLVTFFMGKSRFPLESLAVLPVINALLFIFRSIGLSYTEVAVALLGKNNRNYIPIFNFAMFLVIGVVGILGLMAYTPIAQIWFEHVSGLSITLTGFTVVPTRILSFLPPLTVLIAVQRAVLMNSGKTAPISIATAIEVSLIIGTLLVSIHFMNAVGVVAAGAAYVIGRLFANVYLFPFQRKVAKGLNSF